MPRNVEYPCPRCHQGHCVCDQSAIRTRVFHLEEIRRCPLHPNEAFACVNDLYAHMAKKHPQPLDPQPGSRNGIGFQAPKEDEHA